MTSCPNCDVVTDGSKRYCAHCGYALSESRQESSSLRSASGKGYLESGSAGVLIGIFASPILYVAILSFGNATFGNIGTPPPSMEFGLSKGEAAFDVIVSIVLAISLVAFFVVQPRMNPMLRSLLLTVAFILLGGFLLCDTFAFSALSDPSYHF